MVDWTPLLRSGLLPPDQELAVVAAEVVSAFWQVAVFQTGMCKMISVTRDCCRGYFLFELVTRRPPDIGST